MSENKVDNLPDRKAAEDRGEDTFLMEPLLIREDARGREELVDMALDLASRSAAFRSSLPEGVMMALADLVRAMNCYYSNLIEGHDTHPVDIERALKKDYSADPRQRDLQHEAEAHIHVQRWIDEGGLAGRETSQEGLCEMHRRFCELLPESLLKVEAPHGKDELWITPGALRKRDIQVGRHVPISPGAVPRFLERFEAVYGKLGKTSTILAAASAHHRFLWIHPFLDGNGRVARLMSHTMLLQTLDTGGIWSVARGLARNVDAYKSQLAACDFTRRNDLDGRGSLSEEALVGFTRFFLETCLDQVAFMENLVKPQRLRDSILVWAEEEIRADVLPPKSGKVLEAILYRGELPRAEVPELLGMSDRQARRITSALLDQQVLSAETARSPFRLAFPASLASRWMPGLFPEK
ncbi:MAG: Fic family protein [Pseudohongiellaceae bacterium]